MKDSNVIKQDEAQKKMHFKFFNMILALNGVVDTISTYKRRRRLKKKYYKWKKNGCVLPMPHLGKREVIVEYAEKFAPSVFIETGTYKGDMVYSVLKQFNEIFSIELDKSLSEKAEKKFGRYEHVHILQGQSGEVLPIILKDVKLSCLFWLDAHSAPAPSPILQELQCILSHPMAKKHIILIDDARSFNGTAGYPAIELVKSFIHNIYPDWIFEIKEDIIRTHSVLRKAENFVDNSGLRI